MAVQPDRESHIENKDCYERQRLWHDEVDRERRVRKTLPARGQKKKREKARKDPNTLSPMSQTYH